MTKATKSSRVARRAEVYMDLANQEEVNRRAAEIQMNRLQGSTGSFQHMLEKIIPECFKEIEEEVKGKELSEDSANIRREQVAIFASKLTVLRDSMNTQLQQAAGIAAARQDSVSRYLKLAQAEEGIEKGDLVIREDGQVEAVTEAGRKILGQVEPKKPAKNGPAKKVAKKRTTK